MKLAPERGSPSLKVYTDAPARCIRLLDGHLDFDSPCNVLVQRRASELNLPEAETRLSIRCAFGGQSFFRVDGNRFVVHDDRYLLFNLGQRVATSLYSAVPVECFNITLHPEFVGEVFRSLTTPTTPLLDNPTGKLSQAMHLNVQTYPHDDLVSPVIFR